MGFTILAVCGAIVLLVRALHVPAHWGIIIGLIPCFMSFFWGMVLETRASQLKVYRWIRGILRIILPFGLAAAIG